MQWRGMISAALLLATFSGTAFAESRSLMQLAQRSPGANFEACFKHCSQSCQMDMDNCKKSTKAADIDKNCKPKLDHCNDNCRSSCSR